MGKVGGSKLWLKNADNRGMNVYGIMSVAVSLLFQSEI